MLIAFAVGPRSAAGLAIPGCVVTTIGLILAIQNTFGLWQTWAYAWALIPASVGLGLRLQSERLGQPRAERVGTRMFEAFLFVFVVGFVFFELILNLSNFTNGVLAHDGRPGRADPGRDLPAHASPTARAAAEN